MKKSLRTLLLSAAAIWTLTAPAYAASDPWAGIEVMDDTEMSDLRGGIAVAPGIEVGLGAVITSFVDGQPVLATQLTWTDAGAVIEEAIGSIGQSINDMPSDVRAALGLDGITGGVIINDNKGVTALVHNISDHAMQSIVINNSSGRDVTQSIDVTLSLPNFESMQDLFNLQRLGLRLDADMQTASGQ